VDHADPPFAGERDRHRRFGHGVHCGRNQGDGERDILGQFRSYIGFGRFDGRGGWLQQHVVECEGDRHIHFFRKHAIT
jgi:hypothetical protein